MYVILEIAITGGDKQAMVLSIAGHRLEPIQLATKSKFFSYVRPQNSTMVDWKNRELRNIRPTLLDGEPLETIFPAFAEWLQEDDIIYCWDEKAQSMFRKLYDNSFPGMNRPEVHCIREVVLAQMQDGRKKKGNPVKLCVARGYLVSGQYYDADDVVRAIVLLVKNFNIDLKEAQIPAVREYKADTQQNVKQDNSENVMVKSEQTFPLAYSRTSHRKTVHRLYCAWLNHIPEEKRRFFDNIWTARNAGYHPCSCCSQIRKIYRNSESKLINYCQANSLIVQYHDDTVFIHSKYDFWRIIYHDAENCVKLLHKNTRTNGSHHTGGPVPGFHFQKCDATSIRGMLRYIVAHDDYREKQNRKEIELEKKTDDKRIKKKQKKRKIRRAIFTMEELKSSGKL